VVKLPKAGQVQELVKWANETTTPLIPVSSGAPHFRGDTVPSVGGAVIVDLSGLKEITRIDTINRIAMIEPGVTFGELLPQLRKARLKLNMPLLPRPNKSVVGSMLDREPVIMPWYQWDSQDPLTCVEVVFGNGDMFRTGSAAGPGTLEDQWKAKQAQVNPMGPGQTSFSNVLQGAQGTLGIVTWATVRCEILPKLQKPFFIGSDDYKQLSEFVYRMVWWKAAEECVILNNSNLAAICAKNPDEDEKLKKSLPDWALFFCLAGFEYYPEEKIAYQEKVLAEEAKKAGFVIGNSVGGISADTFLEFLQKPAAEPYWKLRRKGACQDIFFLTTLDKVPQFVSIMRQQAKVHGYSASEIGIYVQPMVQGTSCHCEFDLFYDPQSTGEVSRMNELYLQAGKDLMNAGAFFSRPYGALVDEIYRRDAQTTAALKKVKKIFDPNNVMNPGKLCF
jgi:FAD/FMN-containing dehydrogenase